MRFTPSSEEFDPDVLDNGSVTPSASQQPARFRRAAWRAAEVFTSPVPPQEFARLFNPLVSSRQLRGVVTAVRHETPNSATIEFKPGGGWDPHKAGQYARIGVEIDGARNWRSYSLATAEGHDPAITVTAVGRVSTHLVRTTKRGDVLFLAPPQGDFLLPSGPRPLLMLTAGSGLTPVMSMLRTLLPKRHDADVVVVHSSRTPDETLFLDELKRMNDEHHSLTLVHRFTAHEGRLDLATTHELDELCPDWRSRKTFVCGPQAMLDDAEKLWHTEELPHELTVERFMPTLFADPNARGGLVTFEKSDKEATAEGNTSLLEVGEDAGVLLPSGCRMGICRTCLTPLVSGTVRNLASGELCSDEGELIQTCISAAVGPVHLDA